MRAAFKKLVGLNFPNGNCVHGLIAAPKTKSLKTCFRTGVLEVSSHEGDRWIGLLLCQCFAIGSMEGFGRCRHPMGNHPRIFTTYGVPLPHDIFGSFARFLPWPWPRDLMKHIWKFSGSFLFGLECRYGFFKGYKRIYGI